MLVSLERQSISQEKTKNHYSKDERSAPQARNVPLNMEGVSTIPFKWLCKLRKTHIWEKLGSLKS